MYQTYVRFQMVARRQTYFEMLRGRSSTAGVLGVNNGGRTESVPRRSAVCLLINSGQDARYKAKKELIYYTVALQSWQSNQGRNSAYMQGF